MPEENKELIYNYLKENSDQKFSIRELSRNIKNISYPTLLKWVMVLQAEERISIEDHGNIKLVQYKEK